MGTVWILTLLIVGAFMFASIYFGIWYIDNSAWNVATLRNHIQRAINIIDCDEYGDCHQDALIVLYEALEKTE